LCSEAKKTTLTARISRYAPASGFGLNVQAFAAAFLELYEKRHAADYDPQYRATSSDVQLAIRTGRSAVRRFSKATSGRRKAFLTLLLFSPR
jgi:ATP phosphoribosyltransferase regulatory subunit HisZ